MQEIVSLAAIMQGNAQDVYSHEAEPMTAIQCNIWWGSILLDLLVLSVLYMHADVDLFPSGSMHGYLVLKIPLLYRENTIEKWFLINN
jgi:hypothetical protein